MIEGIDHLYIATRDFDKALRFWQSLGFVVTNSWNDEGHRGVHLESGTARLVLAEDEPAGATVHFATDDLDAFSLMIEGQGGRLWKRPPKQRIGERGGCAYATQREPYSPSRRSHTMLLSHRRMIRQRADWVTVE
jgi:catechol 2,3-dioxygenase-like lactoylglutathione lyase family enzyme